MILSLMPKLQVLFLADVTHNGLMLLSNLPSIYIFFCCFFISTIMLLNPFFLQDIQSTVDLKSSGQGTTEVQSQQPNPMFSDAPAGDSGSLSAANNDNKKVSREDIELVRFKLFCSLYRFIFLQ
jgi:hypothetical protein